MKLKQDIKRMLDALAFQHEADYLSYTDKLKELGVTGIYGQGSDSRNESLTRSANRVAWLTDGTDESLEYALEVCARQQAGLDLVLHGEALNKQASVDALRSSVASAGITHQSVVLRGGTLSELNDYIRNHANLIYLVASTGNPLARALSDNITVAGQHLNIPLVLFDETNSHAALQS